MLTLRRTGGRVAADVRRDGKRGTVVRLHGGTVIRPGEEALDIAESDCLADLLALRDAGFTFAHAAEVDALIERERDREAQRAAEAERKAWMPKDDGSTAIAVRLDCNGSEWASWVPDHKHRRMVLELYGERILPPGMALNVASFSHPRDVERLELAGYRIENRAEVDRELAKFYAAHPGAPRRWYPEPRPAA